MDLLADLQQGVVRVTTTPPWCPSPLPGGESRPLDRRGEEVARAPSVVRQAPGGRFHRHSHGGGGEFLVLSGVFQDENGRCDASDWLRNPPGSVHRPWSEAGCTIRVKTGHGPSAVGRDGTLA
jgi:anti-sigma factor ChrR (cupin superfamily)